MTDAALKNQGLGLGGWCGRGSPISLKNVPWCLQPSKNEISLQADKTEPLHGEGLMFFLLLFRYVLLSL